MNIHHGTLDFESEYGPGGMWGMGKEGQSVRFGMKGVVDARRGWCSSRFDALDSISDISPKPALSEICDGKASAAGPDLRGSASHPPRIHAGGPGGSGHAPGGVDACNERTVSTHLRVTDVMGMPAAGMPCYTTVLIAARGPTPGPDRRPRRTRYTTGRR